MEERLSSNQKLLGPCSSGTSLAVPDLQGDPAALGSLTSALWELSLLLDHYHPHVASAARSLATLSANGKNTFCGTNDGWASSLARALMVAHAIALHRTRRVEDAKTPLLASSRHHPRR